MSAIGRIEAMRAEDRGASLVIIAISMVLLLGIAAVAVDLAGLRVDMRNDRLATDAGATAGAVAIEPFSGSQADVACSTAFAYVLLNLEDEGVAGAPNPACSTFSACTSPNTARTSTVSAPPYTITVIHPVPDDHPLVTGQDLNPDFDGVSCQRLGVTIERERDYTFAAVLGFDTGTTQVSSVARVRPDVGEGDIVPLVLLEPYGCDALTADGQGKVTVKHFEDSPGLIVLDSDGSGADCGASAPYTMEVQANGDKRWIRALPVPGAGGAQSAIMSYALSGQPGADPSRAYNPADLITPIDTTYPLLTGPPESYYQLYPRPIFRSQRVTRSPIDHRYNCKTSYPSYLGVFITPCQGATATHIDDMNILYDKSPGTVPTGAFQRWTVDTTDTDCNVGSGESIVVTGDVWIDCSPRLVINGGSVQITGNIVIDGDLDLRSNGVFVSNPANAGDYWIYFRQGADILKGAQSSITFNRTFVLLREGLIDLVGGTGGLVWTAPTDQTYRFEDLALWSESATQHELGGQSGNVLTGTFFTPYANPFILKGQAGQLQTSAQFVTRRLVVTGFTEVSMEPDPETSTKIPVRGVALIR